MAVLNIIHGNIRLTYLRILKQRTDIQSCRFEIGKPHHVGGFSMSKKEVRSEETKKALGQYTLKKQNPNQQHNTKKESLGPNTKR